MLLVSFLSSGIITPLTKGLKEELTDLIDESLLELNTYGYLPSSFSYDLPKTDFVQFEES